MRWETKLMMTPIKLDRTISIGHILSVLIFFIGGLGAYYDLKGDVRTQAAAISNIQTILADERRVQGNIDADQNKQRDQALLDLKNIMQDNKKDIKDDIRDLRNDIARSPQANTNGKTR